MNLLPKMKRRLSLAHLRETFDTFGHAFEGQRRDIVVAITLAVLGAGLELARPWPIKIVFDQVLTRGNTGRTVRPPFGLGAETLLLGACGLIVLLSLLIGWLNVRQAVLSARVSKTLSTRIRRRVFERLHRLALPFHQSNRTGDLLVRLMGDVNMVRDLLFGSWVSILSRGLLFVGTLAMLFVVDPVLGLVVLAPLPLLLIGVLRSSKKLTLVTKKQRKMEGNAAALAAESLRQIRVVKAYAAEDQTTRRFAREARSGERAGGEAARIAAGVGRLAEYLTGAGLALLIFFGAHRVIDRKLTPGDLVVVVAYARTIFKPLRGLSKEGPKLSKASACAERLFEVLRLPPEEIGKGEPAPDFAGEVEFDEVYAAWEDGPQALNGFSVRIAPRSLAVLQGPNGAGKSTAIAVLLRLIDPRAGIVRVDGKPIGEYELASFRNRIAYVPQETQLFSGTIRDNILYGRPDATDADVEAAAKVALAHDFIVELPNGYESELGENGATVSGGQARRLMLARAALRGASLLLLDEPLTGLDPEVRPVIARAIRGIATGHTVIVVSHGPADELEPDVVVTMDRGRVGSVWKAPTPAVPGRRAWVPE